jgi:hypothetical protein
MEFTFLTSFTINNTDSCVGLVLIFLNSAAKEWTRLYASGA